jgi:uncharacterized GH25 family protein
MYRIFCESLNNYISEYKQNERNVYRYRIVEPLKLIADLTRFEKEKHEKSDLYKRLCDLLLYMENNINQYPKLKAFLWTLESRGLKGKTYKQVSSDEMKEQTKIVNMFLNLMYWDKNK